MSEMKYFFYFYVLNGAPCSGKRTNDTSITKNIIQEDEISKEEFDNATLTQLAYKYPFRGIPDLT